MSGLAQPLHSVLIAQWCNLALQCRCRDLAVMLDPLKEARERLWTGDAPPLFVHQYGVETENEAQLMPALRDAFTTHLRPFLAEQGLNLVFLRALTLAQSPGRFCVTVRYEHGVVRCRQNEGRRRLYNGERGGELVVVREASDARDSVV